MADLAKQLVEAVEKAFTRNCKTDIVVSGIERTLKKNGVSYREAEEYSARLGELLAKAYQETITPDLLPNGKLDADLAEELMRTLLSQNYERAAEVAARVQTSLNRSAGLGIKGLQPAVNEDRLDGLINKAASYESYDKAAWVLNEPVVNYTQSAVEDTIRKNADAHFNAGLQPKIRRISVGGCCKWCNRLAGVYAYPVKREIYKRHERCRCLVLYDPGDGKIQDAHTKVIYDRSVKNAEKAAREARIKEIQKSEIQREGTKLAERIARDPGTLAEFTPESLKQEFEDHGFSVKPLAKGKLKNINFEDGGGWKINYGSEGLIQYHPEEKSHHQGAYYKISSGVSGIHWYDLEGREINVEASRIAGRQIVE